MVKIIERGNLPKETRYRARCARCGSLLEFGEDDVCFDRREWEYVQCPVCPQTFSWDRVKSEGDRMI